MKRDTQMRKWMKISLLILSGIFWIFSFLAYWFQPDALFAYTFFPAWMWGIVGIIAALFFAKLLGKRNTLIISLLWFGFLLRFAEETHIPFQYIRYMKYSRLNVNKIRIASINCAGGSFEAVKEAVSKKPDFILIQESPSMQELIKLSKSVYGKDSFYVYGPDTSIIGTGRVVRIVRDKARAVFTYAEIETSVFKKSKTIGLMSIHVLPPDFRTDLWNIECWNAHKQIRIDRKNDMDYVKNCLDTINSSIPLVVGGDFNAPAGDGIFNVLKPKLRDSFTIGGVGWGNTVLNEVPVERIDQVWFNKELNVNDCRAFETKNSDHRMVICEYYE